MIPIKYSASSTEYHPVYVSDKKINKKRKRTTWACDACRKRHLACEMPEGEVPGKGSCNRCQDSKAYCTWTTRKKTKRIIKNKRVFPQTIDQKGKIPPYIYNKCNKCGICLILQAASDLNGSIENDLIPWIPAPAF